MFNLDMEALCSGTFSDVLDSLGYRKQIIIGMKKNQKKISVLGRARTIKIQTRETNDENIRMGLSFVGKVGAEEILFVQGSEEFAYFGEMMTKLATRNKISAVVIGGMTRDTNYTHDDDVKLPILAKGYSPVDIKGRGCVEAVDVDIVIDKIDIHPQDLVYIDNEAVCIIPKKIEDEVIRLVKEKTKEEERITQLIESGITIDELLETVKEF